jgi:hypothetical protein
MVLWRPEALQAAMGAEVSMGDFAYVMVEELVDKLILLMAWPWPDADDQGRVCWPAEHELNYKTAVTARDLLRYQLYRPNRLQRMPRLGDVYAASHLGPGWEDPNPVTDVRELFDGELYDISPDAREAAKLAYHGAAASFPTAAAAASELDSKLLSEAAKRRAGLTAKRLTIKRPPSRERRP